MPPLYRPTRDQLVTAGDLPPRSYDPAIRYEGSLPPDIELLKAGARFESKVPIKTYEQGEPIVSSTGELAAVNVRKGDSVQTVLLLDTGQGDQSYAAIAKEGLDAETAAAATALPGSSTAISGQADAGIDASVDVPLPVQESDASQVSGQELHEILLQHVMAAQTPQQAPAAPEPATTQYSAGGTTVTTVQPKLRGDPGDPGYRNQGGYDTTTPAATDDYLLYQVMTA